MSLFTYYDESEVETLDPVFENYQQSVSDEHRMKISVARKGQPSPMRGWKLSKEWCSNMSKSQRKFAYHTPKGVFTSSGDAAKALGVNASTIRGRCKDKNFPDYFVEKLDK